MGLHIRQQMEAKEGIESNLLLQCPNPDCGKYHEFPPKIGKRHRILITHEYQEFECSDCESTCAVKLDGKSGYDVVLTKLPNKKPA